jgi:hypothetical protein
MTGVPEIPVIVAYQGWERDGPVTARLNLQST